MPKLHDSAPKRILLTRLLELRHSIQLQSTAAEHSYAYWRTHLTDHARCINTNDVLTSVLKLLREYRTQFSALKSLYRRERIFLPCVRIPLDDPIGLSISDLEKSIRFAIPNCGTTDNPASTFTAFYGKLVDHGQASSFSHENYLQALSAKLHGKVYTDFRQLKENQPSFARLIRSLFGMHGDLPTIQGMKHDLFHFQRLPKEDLKHAFARFEHLLLCTRKLYPKKDRQSRMNMELRNALMQLASPSALKIVR